MSAMRVNVLVLWVDMERAPSISMEAGLRPLECLAGDASARKLVWSMN